MATCVLVETGTPRVTTQQLSSNCNHEQGSWVGGQVVNLEVIDKKFVEPWEWRTDGLNYQLLADDLIKMLTDNYQLQLQSRQQCVYGYHSSHLSSHGPWL